MGMKGLKRMWVLVLLFDLLAIPRAFSHTDPPVMTLTVNPDMPAADEDVKIRINLKGSKAGVPVLGAKIKIVLSDFEGNRLKYKAKPKKKGGEYLSTLVFPRSGLWRMTVEVKHQNELDFRRYMINVMESVSGPRNVMTDETLLVMDKNAAYQPIPPLLVLEGYVLLILLLLTTVTIIKIFQGQK